MEGDDQEEKAEDSGEPDGDKPSSDARDEPAADIPASSSGTSESGHRGRRAAAVSAVALALLAAFVTPAAESVWGATGDALDGVRDFFRGYTGERVDNLKEYVNELDDWVGDPKVFDESFDFLGIHEDAGLASVDGASLEVATVSELIDDAPDYAGDPVYVVAEVVERRSLATDEDGEPDEELLVTDSENGDFAYVGASILGFSDAGGAATGDVIAVRGLSLGTGLTRYEGSRPFRTTYFLAQEEVDTEFGRVPPEIARLRNSFDQE